MSVLSVGLSNVGLLILTGLLGLYMLGCNSNGSVGLLHVRLFPVYLKRCYSNFGLSNVGLLILTGLLGLYMLGCYLLDNMPHATTNEDIPLKKQTRTLKT